MVRFMVRTGVGPTYSMGSIQAMLQSIHRLAVVLGRASSHTRGAIALAQLCSVTNDSCATSESVPCYTN